MRMDREKLDAAFRAIETLDGRAAGLVLQGKQIRDELRALELTLADALRGELER